MKIGLPRQNTLMTWPSAIGARSTSIGAPAAMVELSGLYGVGALLGFEPQSRDSQASAGPPQAA